MDTKKQTKWNRDIFSKEENIMKDYTFKTIKQIASELALLPLNTSIDFTFDTPEEEQCMGKAFEPSGW